MKRPQPDLSVPLRDGYINSLGTLRKFIKYWGTTKLLVDVTDPSKGYVKAPDGTDELFLLDRRGLGPAARYEYRSETVFTVTTDDRSDFIDQINEANAAYGTDVSTSDAFVTSCRTKLLNLIVYTYSHVNAYIKETSRRNFRALIEEYVTNYPEAGIIVTEAFIDSCLTGGGEFGAYVGGTSGIASARIPERFDSMVKFSKLLGQFDEWYGMDKQGAKRVWLRMRPPLAIFSDSKASNEDKLEYQETAAKNAIKNTINDLFEEVLDSFVEEANMEEPESFADADWLNGVEPRDKVLEFDISIGAPLRNLSSVQGTFLKGSTAYNNAVTSAKLVPKSYEFTNDTSNPEALFNELKDNYRPTIWNEYAISISDFTVTAQVDYLSRPVVDEETKEVLFPAGAVNLVALASSLGNKVADITTRTKVISANLLSGKGAASELFGKYLLLSDDLEYEMVNVRSSLIPFRFPIKSYTYSYEDDDYSKTYSTEYFTQYAKSYTFKIKIPYQQLSETSNILDLIIADAKKNVPVDIGSVTEYVNNTWRTRELVYGMPYRETTCTSYDDGGDECTTSTVTPRFQQWVQDYYSERWFCRFDRKKINSPFRSVNGCNRSLHTFDRASHYDEQYLRVSFLNDTSIPLKERTAYLYSSLGSGYSKYYRNPLKKLLAIIVVAVVVYFAGPYALSVAGPLVGAVGAVLIGIGLTIAVVTVLLWIVIASIFISVLASAITLAAAVMVMLDWTEAAGTIANFLNTIAPLVRIANIIATIASITALLQNLAKKGAEAAVNESLKETGRNVTEQVRDQMVQDFLQDNFVEAIMEGAMNSVTNLVTDIGANVDLSRVIKTFDIGFSLWSKNDLDKRESELKTLQDKAKNLAEQEELSRSENVFLKMMGVQFKPMSASWSQYSALYDKRYEGWQSTCHLGNVQCTPITATIKDPFVENWVAEKFTRV